jgi:2-dehydro-3-deoxygalactonokinase
MIAAFMGTPMFIAGDWGTTNLRLSLVDSASQMLESIEGPGVAQVIGSFDTLLSGLIAPWTGQHGDLPIVLCGMVGSTIGWTNVPYVPCPALPIRIADSMVAVGNGAILIAPGLSCRNRYGAPDVMRGEETQILGALQINPSLQKGRHLLCLPGTHAKWVVLDDGLVEEFLTAVTGELFAVVNEHSVLVRSGNEANAFSGSAFDAGAQRIVHSPEAALTHLLFECRSRQVMGELPRAEAADFLSGLLVAHDVSGALRLFADIARPGSTLTVIANSSLAQRYARVVQILGLRADLVDGGRASLAGLSLLHDLRFRKDHNDVA